MRNRVILLGVCAIVMMCGGGTAQAAVTASASGGTLTVQGDANPDIIDITHPSATTIRVVAHVFGNLNSSPVIDPSASGECSEDVGPALLCTWSPSFTALTIHGGGGNDSITGGSPSASLPATIDGEGGDDTVYANAWSPGPDTYIGSGNDAIDYSAISDPIKIIVWDATANDGRNCGLGPCENDDVLPGFRTIVGGQSGDDINASGLVEVLVGLGGADTLNAQSGDDTITGGAGADSLIGESGNDTINADDGAVDTLLECDRDAGGPYLGDGNADHLIADVDDPDSSNCEDVDNPLSPPVNVVPPAVPAGAAVYTGTLTANPGSWSGRAPITITYLWKRCTTAQLGSCTSLTGETASTYQIKQADIGKAFIVKVTATNADGQQNQLSPMTAFVPMPAAPSNPTVDITGLHRVGRTLGSSTSSNGLGVATTVQWQSCATDGSACTNIAGATGFTYQVKEAELGRRMALRATFTNPGGTVTATKMRSGIVHREPSVSCTGLDPALDPDGDGLSNRLECEPVTFPGSNVWMDLPSLGAQPNHKDIFIEIDKMQNHTLSEAAASTVGAAFANAPVSNPDGIAGIRMHIDNGAASQTYYGSPLTFGAMSRSDTTIPHDNITGSFVGGDEDKYDWSEVDTLKATYFERIRSFAFHYTLVSHAYGSENYDSSGIARANDWTVANIGQDTLITLGMACGVPNTTGVDCSGTDAQQQGTLMHELGHTLGLAHGGRNNDGTPDGRNRKPNYPSIMSYTWQFTGVRKTDNTFTLDYSRYDGSSAGGTIGDIDEMNLVENNGVPATGGALNYMGVYLCTPPGGELTRYRFAFGIAVDFSCDGTKSAAAAQIDLDNDGAGALMKAHQDWDRLIFKGGAIGDAGSGTGGAGADDPVELEEANIDDPPAQSASPDVDATFTTLMTSARAASGDALVPGITIKAPRQRKRHGRWVRPLKVTIIVTDNLKLDRYIVKVDAGKPVVNKTTATRHTYVVKLAKGRHKIRVTGYDWLGNQRIATKSIRVR